MRSAVSICGAFVALLAAREAIASECRTPPAPEGSRRNFTRARAEFSRGTRLLDREAYPEAEAALRCSLELRESLPALFNLALAYHGQGQLREAHATLERHIRLAVKQRAPELARARRLARIIRARLAELTVPLRAGDSLLVDGAPFSPSSGGEGMLLDPGEHALELDRDGFEPLRRVVVLERGSRSTIELEPIARVVPPEPVRASTAGAELEAVAALDARVTQIPVVPPAPRLERVVVEPLAVEEPALTERWWFWTAIVGVGLAGAGGALLLLRRDQPEAHGSLPDVVVP